MSFPICSRCNAPTDGSASLCEKCQGAAREAYAPLTFERVVAEAGSWERQRLEVIRQERHHEVLCLVLQELVTSQPNTTAAERGVHVEMARDYANLAYPPPEKQ